MGTLFNRLKKYTLHLFFIIAILLLTIYYSVKIASPDSFKIHETTFREIFGFGLTILGSGVFLAVMKWLQFLNFFQEEINKMIDSSRFDDKLGKVLMDAFQSDKFLKTYPVEELTELWSRVNRTLFKNQFSDQLADQVEKKMADIFLENKKLSHYYEDFVLTLRAKLDDQDYLTMDIEIDTSVITQSEEPFLFEMSYYALKKDKVDSKAAVTFHKIIIDNQDEYPGNVQLDTNNDERIQRSFKKKLQGRKKYKLVLKLSLTYSIQVDYEFQMLFERFVDNLRVQVDYSTNLATYFVVMGNDHFDTVLKEPNRLSMKHTGMLFPEKGFTIIFVKK